MDKDYKRHRRIWKFLRVVVSPFFKAVYGFSYDDHPAIGGNFLLLSNHVTNLDPALIGISFPEQMYFVASENVYRAGFASKILRWAFEPVAKMKGATDAGTVMKMIRMLRGGKNVCLFPEGNRTFDGSTCEIMDATGKLVKVSGAHLVTYRFTGGYFTNPRWGYGIRKGRMHGSVVNVYSPEQIAAMSPEEVMEHIREDLAEDAYARQEKERIRFRGKNLARGMECLMAVCPKCRKTDTISTAGNTVSCGRCGRLADYDPYGFFNDGFIFRTIREWNDWQEGFYRELAEAAIKSLQDNEAGSRKSGVEPPSDGAPSAVPIFTDQGVTLNTVSSDHSSVSMGTGRLSLYADRLLFTPSGAVEAPCEGGNAAGAALAGVTVCLADISDMSVFGKCTLLFTDRKGTHYEVKPAGKKELRNVRKYLSVWKLLKEAVTE